MDQPFVQWCVTDTYVEEESPLSAIESIADIPLVVEWSVYHQSVFSSASEKKKGRRGRTVKSQSDLTLVVAIPDDLDTGLSLDQW